MRIAAFSLLLAVAGCATPVYEHRYSYDRGWRVGKVLAVGDPASFGAHAEAMEDCRPELKYEEMELALVRYYREGRPRLRIAFVAPDRHVEVAAKVYVHVNDCRAPVAVASPDAAEGQERQ